MSIKDNFAEKRKVIESAKVQLKSELLGMDKIIDRIMQTIEPWYLCPQVMTRPMIVNLWGMTGTGKTQLVRRIVELLDFKNRFLEMQMDDLNNRGQDRNNIASIIEESCLDEMVPGVLLLDEFQRFRTVSMDGDDTGSNKFQDVWMLLSDGKLPSNLNSIRNLEYLFWDLKAPEIGDPPTVATANQGTNRPLIPYYRARNLRKQLKIEDPIEKIMYWTEQDLIAQLEKTRAANVHVIDYTKLLIFISGNLDEAFHSSLDVENTDSDADFFHRATQKVDIVRIKSALCTRFRPEQIGRLGNIHIIFPSLSKDSFKGIIRQQVKEVCSRFMEETGINVSITDRLYDEIYTNGVYPAQGTRPVMASIQMMVSGPLMRSGLIAMDNGIDNFVLDIETATSEIIAINNGIEFAREHVDLDIREIKKKASHDFNLTVAIHEAGHAVVMAAAQKIVPSEIKINTNHGGGYVSSEAEFRFIAQDLAKITTLMGGLIAEEICLGTENRSSGSWHDLKVATSIASELVRHHSYVPKGCNPLTIMVGTTSSIHDATFNSTTVLDHSGVTDDLINQVLINAQTEARRILNQYQTLHVQVVQRLMEDEISGYMSGEDFRVLAEKHMGPLNGREPVETAWKSYQQSINERQQ